MRSRNLPLIVVTRVAPALAMMMVAVSVLDAHDLFLKPAAFFVDPGGEVRVHVLNGTFSSSESGIDRARLRDLSLALGTEVGHPDTSTWVASGKSSTWRVRVKGSGSYVLGASVRPRTLQLDAKAFNAYLAEDGLPQILALRRSRGELGQSARERYSKHVKAIVQVGAERSARVDAELGYPAELVALDNPYALRAGGVMRLRALVDGAPARNQLVIAGGHTARGVAIAERRLETDSSGVVAVPLRSSGVWYVKFIRMRRIETPGDSVDYESKWATLTFAVR